MYYTVIKHSSHLRTLGKCRKHSPAARAFYISLVFSNACRVLSQCNTRLRLLYLLNKISLPICLLLTHELLQNAKLISFITSHHYNETTQCILCNCHNPLQTGLKITKLATYTSVFIIQITKVLVLNNNN